MWEVGHTGSTQVLVYMRYAAWRNVHFFFLQATNGTVLCFMWFDKWVTTCVICSKIDIYEPVDLKRWVRKIKKIGFLNRERNEGRLNSVHAGRFRANNPCRGPTMPPVSITSPTAAAIGNLQASVRLWGVFYFHVHDLCPPAEGLLLQDRAGSPSEPTRPGQHVSSNKFHNIETSSSLRRA